jgi:hypothetical protein
MKSAILVAVLTASTGFAVSARAATCEAFEVQADRLSKGDCSIRELPGEKFAQDITVKGQTFRVIYVDRQGQFHRWTINGRPAAAYEINRTSYCGWTDDLQVSVCFDTSARRPKR